MLSVQCINFFFRKISPNYSDEPNVPIGTNGVCTPLSHQKVNILVKNQMLEKKPYLMLVSHFEMI